jgi:hypothetical protein
MKNSGKNKEPPLLEVQIPNLKVFMNIKSYAIISNYARVL